MRIAQAGGKPALDFLALGTDEPGTPVHHLVLPLRQLPLNADLVLDGKALDLVVLHLDPATGLCLLRCATALPLRGLRLAPGPDTTSELRSISRRRIHPEPLRILADGVPLHLDRALPAARVLVDAEDRALAYSLGGQEALGLWHLHGWLASPRGRPLAEVQAELRAKDPDYVLEDARALMGPRRSVADIEKGIRLLDQALYAVRDQDTAAAFDDALRFGHQQRVRTQSASDGVKALEQAREGLQRFADHHALRADAVELALDHGAPLEALDLFATLQQLAPEYAQSIADRVQLKLKRLGQGMLDGGDTRNTLDLLRRATRLFPRHAELSLLLTRALAAGGDSAGAAAQARYTLGLDPNLQRRLRPYLESQASGRGGRRLVIPFAAGSTQIRTNGAAGREALNFIVDTGASYTTVPRGVAQRLGLLRAGLPRVRVRTASGEVDSVQVVLPELTVGGKLRLRQVKALVLDLPGGVANESLLGLNVLQRLNMRIDSGNRQLILTQSRK